jgi:hypothetical protein
MGWRLVRSPRKDGGRQNFRNKHNDLGEQKKPPSIGMDRGRMAREAGAWKEGARPILEIVLSPGPMCFDADAGMRPGASRTNYLSELYFRISRDAILVFGLEMQPIAICGMRGSAIHAGARRFCRLIVGQ